MNTLDKTNHFLNRIFLWIAGAFLLGMVLLTCANILLRLFGHSVSGTYELMGLFGSVVTAFALGYTRMSRGHVSVDVLINTFSENTKSVLNIFNDFICLIFFVIASWQMAKKATTLLTSGEVTETLRIIYYPFTYAVAAGCVLLSLVFLTDLIRHPEKPGEK